MTKKSIKFCHLADTHIRNLKFHYEYKVVFQRLYEILKEQEVDYIIHCGDIAHTKTQISPEFVEMASSFFRNLSSIAPTYVILGNHDGNLKNSSRQDAITPIVDALGLKNLHLLKNSGETDIGNNVVLNVLSVFDEDNWVKPSDKDKINIALYHGPISGVKTDMGWVMSHGDHNIEIFEGHDYAFLGDIHKTNQILDTEGRVRYCGSTVQQNHGETNDKGFLIWDIASKDKFQVEHHILENPRPFITIELTQKGLLPRTAEVPSGARLRLVANNNIPLDKFKKAVDIAKKKYNPESITFLNKAAGSRSTVAVQDSTQENLRDIVVQERLIREFLGDYDVDDEVLDEVYRINNHYNHMVESEEEVQRNITWNVKKLEWDNLFNYGEGNSVDFDSIGGIVGIFGKNYSGKSSIIDSLLWTIFNSTSKKNRKTLDTINQNCEYGRGRAEIQIGNKMMIVERRAEKYVKKSKGEEITEAKTILNFEMLDLVTGETISLNGEDRKITDKNIRRYFGNLEDFLFTSMASQLESLMFIGEGSTKRKNILAKFLDLEFFDKKYNLCSEETKEMRGAIKRLEEIDFEQELLNIQTEITSNTRATTQQKAICDNLKKENIIIEQNIAAVQSKIDESPEQLIDIDSVRSEYDSVNSRLNSLIERNDVLSKRLQENALTFDKIRELEAQFDAPSYEEKSLRIKLLYSQVKELQDEIEKTQKRRDSEEKKIELLSSVPCGKEFSHCKFIKDAYAALESIGITKEEIESLSGKKSTASQELESLEPERVEDYLDKYNKVLQKKAAVREQNSEYEVELARNESQILSARNTAEALQEKIEGYNKNKELFDSLEGFVTEKKKLNKQLSDNLNQLSECEKNVLTLHRSGGSLEQKFINLESQREELSSLRMEYAARDLFMSCMHSNGISLDVIKRELPRINEEIAKVLANVVDFQVSLENDGNNLDISIRHPKFDPRPLEMGSGAEKSIAAMAIRLALLNVTTMPKGDIFIMDEPATALDEDNMEGFIRIMDLVKTGYKSVLLISHLDTLKDAVDTQIAIERKGKFAFVNQ